MKLILAKIVDLVKEYQYHLFLSVCIIFISFTSYNLGKINALQKIPVKIVESGKLKMESSRLKADLYSATQSKLEADSQKLEAKKLDTRVVVSKASTSKKYHYVWCSSFKKIKLENQIWFNSDKEAETAGYTLARNCEK